MKLVFTADLHCDSRFSGVDSRAKNAVLVSVFKGIVEKARELDAPVLLGGDIFDSPFPSPEILAAVTSVITSNPDTRFFAVAGNHDPLYKTAFYSSPPDNMYVFPETVTSVKLGDITLTGVSMTDRTDTRDIWRGFHADGNTVTLSHGTVDGEGGFRISSSALSDSGARLSLIGHIHKQTDITLQNGRHAIYCGCPAGRGFDECGAKGFYVIDTDTMNYTFVNTNAVIYKEYTVDITDTCSVEELLEKLYGIERGENETARALLTGKLSSPYPIDCETVAGLTGFYEIKDCSEIDRAMADSTAENTLEGEFLRILNQRLENAGDNEKRRILDAMKEGILAIRGGKK